LYKHILISEGEAPSTLGPEPFSPSESNESSIRNSIFKILEEACRDKPHSVSKDFVRQIYEGLEGLRKRLGKPSDPKVDLKFDYYEVIESTLPPHTPTLFLLSAASPFGRIQNKYL